MTREPRRVESNVVASRHIHRLICRFQLIGFCQQCQFEVAFDRSYNMSIVELLGPKVQAQDGEVAVESFCGEGKYVGLYFSAHWCPPCRGFTPVLADFYKNIKASKKAGMLEIVFISSDRDQKSFDEYYAEMPWKALSFSDRERKDNLCGKFGIRGIPSFVLLDAKDGSVVVGNARENVMGDPKGENFPWK